MNIRNYKHRTPLMMATKYDVITLLQKYTTCYEDYPVHTFNKVILCGDAGAGKSSLAKVKLVNIVKSISLFFYPISNVNEIFSSE